MKFNQISLLILIGVFLSEVIAIDLCIFFGTCNNNNNRQNFNFNARSDPGPEFTTVDNNWIEPKNGPGNVLYHFGSGLGPSDWYSADSYCSEKGGYLAEPSSDEEQRFLVAKARQYPNAIWWIGLRLTEDCQCIGSSLDSNANGRSLEATKTSFEASIDYDSLTDRNAERSPVLTVCPPGFEKVCVGPTWRWGYSSQKMGFSRWNQRSGEPNGRNLENCVALWFEHDYNWSDWTCKTANAGPHPFKAICQKDKPIASTGKRDVDSRLQKVKENGIRQFDDYDSVDKNVISTIQDDESIRCVEYGVAYRSRDSDIIHSILRVDSADLCRQYCAEDPRCRFWTWFGYGPKQKCILKSGIRQTGFRMPKAGAASGTMLNNCQPDVIPTPMSPASKYGFDTKNIFKQI